MRVPGDLKWLVYAIFGLVAVDLVILVIVVLAFTKAGSVSAGLRSDTNGQARITATLNRVTSRLSNDENFTCLIQARGLPASHYLARVVGDLSTYLGESLATATPAQKAAVPAKQLLLLEDLKVAGDAYVRIENQQPHFRVCLPAKHTKKKR